VQLVYVCELTGSTQIDLHPFQTRTDVVQFCKAHNIHLEAWAPLVRGLRFTHPAIAALAEKHRKAPAQVLLRYAVQKGFVAIPKSASRARIAANADIFDFALSAAELAHLDTLDEGASPSALRGSPLWSCVLGVLHHCGAYYPFHRRCWNLAALEPRCMKLASAMLAGCYAPALHAPGAGHQSLNACECLLSQFLFVPRFPSRLSHDADDLRTQASLPTGTLPMTHRVRGCAPCIGQWIQCGSVRLLIGYGSVGR
jgi:hypothetical protein